MDAKDEALELFKRIAAAVEHMAGLTGHVPAAPAPAPAEPESTGQTEGN